MTGAAANQRRPRGLGRGVRARGAERAELGCGGVCGVQSLGQSLGDVAPGCPHYLTAPLRLPCGLRTRFLLLTRIIPGVARPFLETPNMGVSPFCSFEYLGHAPCFLSSNSGIL